MDMINSNESLRMQLVKYPQIEHIFNKEFTTVKSLKEMARLKVRKCLDQKLILKVNQLPIPQTLKDYVSMIDIFGVSTKTSSSSNLNNNNKHNCQLEEINHEYPSNKDMGFNIEDNCFKMNHKLQNKLPDHQPFFMPKQAVERATRLFMFKKRSS
jgi:hypothetical protein